LAQHNLERQLTPEIQLFVIPDPSIVIPDPDPGSTVSREDGLRIECREKGRGI
jgi:hypothetical protein